MPIQVARLRKKGTSEYSGSIICSGSRTSGNTSRSSPTHRSLNSNIRHSNMPPNMRKKPVQAAIGHCHAIQGTSPVGALS